MRLSLLLALLIALLAIATCQAQAPRPNDPVLKFLSYGLQVKTPSGYTRYRENGIDSAVIWTKTEREGRAFRNLIRVEVQPADGTLRELADQLATRTGMSITSRTAKLGAINAFELAARSGELQPGLQPVICRIAIRGKLAYCLYGYSRNGRPERSAFDEVASSVQLSAPVGPSSALVKRDTLFPLFRSGMAFSPPDPFRQTADTSSQQAYKTYNLLTNRPEATITITLGPEGLTSLEQVQKAMVEQAKKSFAWQQEPTWTQVQAEPAVVVSSPSGRSVVAGEKYPAIQFLLALSPEGKCIAMIIQYPEAEPGVVNRYAPFMDEMGKSIRLVTIETPAEAGQEENH